MASGRKSSAPTNPSRTKPPSSPAPPRCERPSDDCRLGPALIGTGGNTIPLAPGLMTDILAGSPRPFQSNTHAQALAGAWLIRTFPFYAPHSRHALGIYCLILIICVLLKGAMSFTTRCVLIGVFPDIEFDLRAGLLDRLLLLEPEFYVRNRTGELMSRATNDLNNVRMALGPGIMYTAPTPVTMVSALVIMARLSPALTWWVLLPVP